MSNAGYIADGQYLPHVISIIASGKTYDRDSSGSTTGRTRTDLLLVSKRDWYQPHYSLAIEEGQGARYQL